MKIVNSGYLAMAYLACARSVEVKTPLLTAVVIDDDRLEYRADVVVYRGKADSMAEALTIALIVYVAASDR